MSSFTSKQIQQETFDAIVREGIEEFGLSPEEAVTDAKEQLEKTGITDFSNISCAPPQASRSTDDDNSPASLVDAVNHAVQNCSHDKDKSGLDKAVFDLLTAVETEPHMSSTIGAHNAVQYVTEALSVTTDQPLLAAKCCKLLALLCWRDDANRERFTSISATEGKGVFVLKQCLRDAATKWIYELDGDTAYEALHDLMRAIMAVQRRNERMKRYVAMGDSPNMFVTVIRVAGERCSIPAVNTVSTACAIVRQSLSADDPRVDAAECFPRARVFAGEKVVTGSGLQPLAEENLISILSTLSKRLYDGDLMSYSSRQRRLLEVLSTARACALSNEICKQIADQGLLDICKKCLHEFSDTEDFVATSLQLLRSVSLRDECKTPVFEGINVIQDAVHKHVPGSPKIASAFCGIIGQLSLKRPDLALKMADMGVADSVVEIMSMYSTDVNVLSVGCLAIRNLCSRDPKARQRVRGNRAVEQLLRGAMKRFPGECDIAYYALREMDVLKDEELRRDERYTMPAEFYMAARKR